MKKLLLVISILIIFIGCTKEEEIKPVQVLSGGPVHWDAGDKLLKHPLRPDKNDDYIQLGRGTDLGYGIMMAKNTISPRSHNNHDLLLYVHSGSARLHVADKDFTASTGDVIYIPRGSVYTATSLNNRNMQFLAVYSPAFDGVDIIKH